MEPSQPDEILVRLSSELTIFEREHLRQWLIDQVNYLLLNDFNQLVQLLYRVDVNEDKLKKLLQEQPQTDASVLIADLLIQRQEEKQQAAPKVQPEQNISEEDKW